MSAVTDCYNIVLVAFASGIGQGYEIKGIREEEINPTLITDDMLLSEENLKESSKKLELVRGFCNKRKTISTKISFVCVYTSNESLKIDILEHYL